MDRTTRSATRRARKARRLLPDGIENYEVVRMKKTKLHWLIGIALLVIALSCVVVAVAKRSRPSTGTITINNNSSIEIRHLYYSHVGQDDWSADQINATITAGSSKSVTLSWEQPEIRLIGEDQNGCFIYQTMAFGDAIVWTIGNDARFDCGG